MTSASTSGFGVADGLNPELMVLPQPTRLRPFIAKDRRDIEGAHRLRERVHPVLNIGAAHRRGPLRPQRQHVVAAVCERIHLLFDDVRPLADGAHKQRRLLKYGGVDPSKTETMRDVLRRGPHPVPIGLIVRQRIVGAANGLESPSAPALSSDVIGAINALHAGDLIAAVDGQECGR